MFKSKNSYLSALAAVCIAALLPGALRAQESSINVFSPYSMYGIGEINTPGSLAVRSMGGAGVAQRSISNVNLLNPAAYSVTLSKSVLFNFGLEGQSYYNSQRQPDGSTARTSYNTFNFHDIALQIPIAKRLGLGFSLTPYSSVGYRFYDREILADVGLAEYDYTGEGDVTEVKLGMGWEIFKNFSIGVAAQYFWGDIDRNFTTTIIPYTGSGSIPAVVGSSNYSISRVKGQVGLQYTPILNKKRILTVGATYDIGGDLEPRVTEKIVTNSNFESVAKTDETHLAVVLPHRLTAGLFYETNRFAAALDYTYENWGSRNTGSQMAAGGFEVAYCNTSTVKCGVEWTPNRNDVRNFLRRWHYRAGFSYGDYHQTFGGKRLPQYAVTLGFGIPVKFGGFSAIDVGFEYGCRGMDDVIRDNVGIIKQNYFKFAIGFALFGDDYWFVRPKYD